MNHLHAGERNKRKSVNEKNRTKRFIEIVTSKRSLGEKLILIIKSEKNFNEKGKDIDRNLYLRT